MSLKEVHNHLNKENILETKFKDIMMRSNQAIKDNLMLC